MAQYDDETAAVADIYAEALLAAAAEQRQDDVIAQQFAELIRLMDENAELAGFLTSEAIDDDPRRASLERIFRGRMSDLLLNTLQVLNNRGRLALLRAVARCVELRIEAKHHQKEVVVETAMPLTDELKDAVRREMRDRLGREIILIEQVKPELIGGIVIHYGDVQIDASVASRIERTHKRLRERATEEIYSGRGYGIEA
jgi:F-type H+-transporting ATPase subunit delta